MECPKCRESVSDDVAACPACEAPLTWRALMPNGQSFGPYTTEALRQYVAEGRIPATANVVQEATGVQMALSRAGFVAAAADVPAAAAALAAGASAERRGHFQRNWYIYLIAAIVSAALVVPAVIGAAIMFPVFAKAREKARQTACLSNIKQLSLACLMYTSDYDERFPTAVDPKGFHDQIFPYVRNEGLFTCPSAPNEPGYAFNPNLAGKSLEDIRNPGQVPMLWDAGAQPGGVTPVPGTTGGRHNGGDNVAYVDGHAKWLSSQAVSGLSTEVPSAEGSPE